MGTGECLNDNCANKQKTDSLYCSTCKQRAYRSKKKEKEKEKTELSAVCTIEPRSTDIKAALHTSSLWTSLRSLQLDQGGLQHIDSKKELFVNYRHNEYTDPRNDSSLRSLTPSIHTEIKNLIDKCIIHEAEKLVNKLEKKVVKVNFSGFAILFAFSSDFEQIPHIDAEASDYIFFYVLGPSVVPSTLVYKGDDVTHQEAAEFLNLPLDTKIAQIGHFRNFFQSRANIVKNMRPVSEEGWQPGTLCVLKGGKIHAAPKHKEPRAVLVFFGTPEIASDTYKSDTQWHTWSVINDLLLNNNDFDDDARLKLMKAHTKVIGDWLIDERCLRHSSFLSDMKVATKYLQSLLTQNQGGKKMKKIETKKNG